MGREIRRVPADWAHPHDQDGSYRPLYDKTFEEAARAWWEKAVAWHAGQVDEADRPQRDKYPWYWQWNSDPPKEEYYRPAFTGPADAYQIYETVSEGTPVSPVFRTMEEMRAWLVQPIDRTSEWNPPIREDWQCMQGMTPAQADRFIQDGSCLSLFVQPGVGIWAGHKL